MATKKQTNDNPIESAEKTLANLIAKRDRLASVRAADDAELAAVVFHAHTGDKDAAERLDAIRERAAKREIDIKSIDAAIAVAQQNVESAKANEAAAEQKRLAGEARVIVDRIDSLFASAHTHFKQAFDALKAADARIEELHGLGFAFPTAVQTRANIIYALETCLMSLPKYLWQELSRGGMRFLAPNQRRTFSQFWAQMSASIGREIATRLGETKHEKEVA